MNHMKKFNDMFRFVFCLFLSIMMYASHSSFATSENSPLGTQSSYVTFTTSGAGWFRVGGWTTGGKRGSIRVVLSTTGGSFTPQSLVIDAYKNWGNTVSLNVKGIQNSYFPNVRIVSDGDVFLEVYTDRAITGASGRIYLYQNEGYSDGFNANSGALPPGSGNVLVESGDVVRHVLIDGGMRVPFSWSLTDYVYDRPIFKSGWLTNVGDYIDIKHGGANSETNTFGLRISDAKGLDFGRDDYNVNLLKITPQGLVGIGSTNPDSKLTVKGNIHAQEVKVDLNVSGPDYVFEEDYDLPTLESLHNYIRENKHLPEVPSAEEMEANGIDLGVMNMLLLKKVEELTLHLIKQNANMERMQNEITELKKINK